MIKDITGQTYGRLLVIEQDGVIIRGSAQKRLAAWKCLCSCGETVRISGASLRNGNTESCGCIARELTVKRNTTHGKSKTKEYHAYLQMIKRCTDENSDDYKNYGGRGIKVCDRWAESFENFCQDMGERPVNHSLDRVDVNGDYSPDNCRWADSITQARNKRNNRWVEYNGKNYTVAELSELLQVPYTTLIYQLNHGLFKIRHHQQH